MQQNEYLVYLLAKIGADTAENEQHFAENFPKFCRSAVVRGGPRGGAGRPRGWRGGAKGANESMTKITCKLLVV